MSHSVEFSQSTSNCEHHLPSGDFDVRQLNEDSAINDIDLTTTDFKAEEIIP